MLIQADALALRAPFPWFGGKSRAAHLIWPRFGDVSNYVEPFFGSGAVLLRRPDGWHGSETINDLDCYVANFWRAVKADPATVAQWADWPVNEADILARHEWLLAREDFRQRMRTEPDYYDAKIAGWWVWGLCSWIGSGWCRERREGHPPQQLPHLGNAGMGIHRSKLPHPGNAGVGIHRSKLPHLGNAGRGEQIAAWFRALSDRLSRVRVACGEWDRVLGDSVTIEHGTTAVLLDPPYDESEHSVDYGPRSASVFEAVRTWALANGDNPDLRIALCGYDGAEMSPEWDSVAWKAHGGYGSQGNGRGRDNASRERIWFSPGCVGTDRPWILALSDDDRLADL